MIQFAFAFQFSLAQKNCFIWGGADPFLQCQGDQSIDNRAQTEIELN
jgi:hypothetical protein